MSSGVTGAGEPPPADTPWTIRRMLAWMTGDFAGRGIESARLDAEVLLAHAVAMPRVKLYLDMERPLAVDELARVRELTRRRRRHEPVAYILGQREFYSRVFAVDARVLIPRPDTELLVDEALRRLPTSGDCHVLDLCTGSGCVGLTLAAERPGLRVDMTDVSAGALEVARRNADLLGVTERVTLREGDLWDAVSGPVGGYQLVLANPPYVRASDHAGLAPGVREHEPRLALVAGDDGFSFYRRIAQGVGAVLAPGGHVLVEVGEYQAETVGQLFSAQLAHVGSVRDLSGIPRVVWASNGPHLAAPPGEPYIEHVQEVAPEGVDG